MDNPAFFHDSQFRLVFANLAYYREAGVTESEALGKPYWDVFPKGKEPLPSCGTKTHNDNDQTSIDEFTFGNKTFLSQGYKADKDAAGLDIFFHVLTDITLMVATEKKLENMASQLKVLFEISPDAIMLLDDKSFFECNPATLAMFGCKKRSDFIGKHPSQFSPRLQPGGIESAVLAGEKMRKALMDGHNLFEWEHCKLDGSVFPAEVLLLAFKQDGKLVLQATVRDITARKNNEALLAFQVKQNKIQSEQILQQSLHDALTKLANRLLLHDRLALTLAANRRSACHGALLFIDLDNFKPANDLYGHYAGDLVLIEVANRLNCSVRLVDTVARLGGDEFVVLITELKQDQAMAKTYALAIAEEIRLSLAKPYILQLKDDHQQTQTVEHHCTASIGVILFDGNVGSEDEVLDHADKAMYRAKEAGRNRIEFFQEVK